MHLKIYYNQLAGSTTIFVFLFVFFVLDVILKE